MAFWVSVNGESSPIEVKKFWLFYALNIIIELRANIPKDGTIFTQLVVHETLTDFLPKFFLKIKLYNPYERLFITVFNEVIKIFLSPAHFLSVFVGV